MATFRKYGGTNYSPISNIVRHNILNSKSSSFNTSGLYNSKETYLSHVDMSGNSLLHVGNIFFQDGTSLSSGTAINPGLQQVLNNGSSAGGLSMTNVGGITYSGGTIQTSAYTGGQAGTYQYATLTLGNDGQITNIVSNTSTTGGLEDVLNVSGDGGGKNMTNLGNITQFSDKHFYQSGTGVINQVDTTTTRNILKDTSFNGNITQANNKTIVQIGTNGSNTFRDTSFGGNISVNNIFFSNGKQQNTSYTGWQPIVDTSYNSATLTFDNNGKIINVIDNSLSPFGLENVLTKNGDGGGKNMTNLGNIEQANNKTIVQNGTTGSNTFRDTSFGGNISVKNIFFLNGEEQNTSYTGWQPDVDTSYNSATLKFNTDGKIIDVIDNSLSPFGLENVLTKNGNGGGKDMTNLGNIEQANNKHFYQSGTGVINQVDTTTENKLKATKFNGVCEYVNSYDSYEVNLANSIPDRAYVDSIASGIKPTNLCNCATTEGLDFNSIPSSIDTVTLENDFRVLVKSQGGLNNTSTLNIGNGIYVYKNNTLTRAEDCSGIDVTNQLTFISDGSLNKMKAFVQDISGAVAGIDALRYVPFYSLNYSLGQGLELVGGATLQVESSLNFLTEITVSGNSNLKIGPDASNNYAYLSGICQSGNVGDTLGWRSFNESNWLYASRVTTIYDENNNTGPFSQGNPWYNLVNVRHRGGDVSGGHLFGCQIVTGMTDAANYSKRMSFRSQVEGSWTNWCEVATLNNELSQQFTSDVNISGTLNISKTSENIYHQSTSPDSKFDYDWNTMKSVNYINSVTSNFILNITNLSFLTNTSYTITLIINTLNTGKYYADTLRINNYGKYFYWAGGVDNIILPNSTNTIVQTFTFICTDSTEPTRIISSVTPYF
jgi:hypothetical protein